MGTQDFSSRPCSALAAAAFYIGDVDDRSSRHAPPCRLNPAKQSRGTRSVPTTLTFVGRVLSYDGRGFLSLGARMVDKVEQHTPSDQQLVHATLEGDLSAFGVLVERHWNMVVALALSRTGDVAEAEDIAQESFLRGYTHLRSLRDPSRFTGWLSKITLQQCANSLRRDARQNAALGNVNSNSSDPTTSSRRQRNASANTPSHAAD